MVRRSGRKIMSPDGVGMKIRNTIVVIATTFLFTATAFAADHDTIYIDIAGEGKFEVVYHRAKSTATGAVIGGLIGAGIQSGIESGKDQEKTDQLAPLLEKGTWKVRFLDTLNDKLEAAGFEAIWVENKKDIGDGFILRIYPENYGFKMVDTSTHEVSAFIDFKASFTQGGSKNAGEGEKEQFYLTSNNRYVYENLLGESSLVNTDLSAVLEKAAKRLANKIIYSMKE